MSKLLPSSRLNKQSKFRARGTNGNGALEMLEGLRLPANNGCRTPKAVMNPGDQDLGEKLLTTTPVFGKSNEFPGNPGVVGLQVTGGSEERKLGAVRVVLQGTAFYLGQTVPVTKLPLDAGAFE
ncbi:hypothetical protein E4Q23_07700 [Candidatus Accumulibacter phosphatis]|uniref:Uncharacterized protein n=1 Tax=Candidatus Accumulibacter phosphatis TaxID=327160 RepID=A0ABX1TYA0_9PROT|nr:hypothetical protein [Candidatus Accumulibacter phosphatis]NMQ27648.1 hypothetical protein [Candidatus Accumulibacter phosphatis]